MFTAEEYLKLITSEHADKPRFVSTVSVSADASTLIKNLLDGMRSGTFDLDDAVGVQLDTVGEWVGISRNIDTPITNVYFSFDIEGLGFDQGAWKGPFDPTDGITRLDDDTYRLLLRARIGANQWDGTMESSKEILDLIFDINATGTYAFIRDNQDMTMTVGIAGTVPPALNLALLTKGYISIKPSTVGIDYFIVTSENDSPLFGFDSNNEFIGGFDFGSWGTLL
jgi:hypothetical protein